MRGWAVDVTEWTPTEEFGNEVVGIVCDKDYSKPERIVEMLEQRPLGAVFVIRARDALAAAACAKAGVEPVVADLNPWWERSVKRPVEGPLNMIRQGSYAEPRLERRKYLKEILYDSRALQRRWEMLRGCTRVWVFRKASSASMDEWNPEYGARGKVIPFVVGRAKPKADRHRRGRNPDAV